MTDLRARYGAPAAPEPRALRRRILLAAALCSLGTTAMTAAEILLRGGEAMLTWLIANLIGGLLFCTMLLLALKSPSRLSTTVRAAAAAVAVWCIAPALIAGFALGGATSEGLSLFMLLLQLPLIGSIRMLVGILGAAVFGAAVRRGQEGIRRI